MKIIYYVIVLIIVKMFSIIFSVISAIGEFYTSDYCQRRCTSLREQYNREKKKMENQSRSGSAAPNSKSRPFPLYSKLTFLDQVIKRRR